VSRSRVPRPAAVDRATGHGWRRQLVTTSRCRGASAGPGQTWSGPRHPGGSPRSRRTTGMEVCRHDDAPHASIPGEAHEVAHQLAPDAPAHPVRVDEEVLEFDPVIRLGDAGEADQLVACHRDPRSALPDRCVREVEDLGVGKERRAVAGVRERRLPEHSPERRHVAQPGVANRDLPRLAGFSARHTDVLPLPPTGGAHTVAAVIAGVGVAPSNSRQSRRPWRSWRRKGCPATIPAPGTVRSASFAGALAAEPTGHGYAN
jgi:hypothetical protein